MGWQQAQHTLTWISFFVGLTGFLIAMVLHVRYDRQHRYDWPERIARSAFVYLQCALWGTIGGLMVLPHLTTFDFGGVK